VVMVRFEPMPLDHGAHRTVENKDAIAEQAVQQLIALVGHAIAKNKNPSARAGRACHALAAFIKRPQAEFQIGAITR
jgi:hypothetical protein